MMAGRLAGRTALITGGGGGIGRAAAMTFAAEGARVVVVDANATAGTATVRAVEAAGGTAAFTVADVTSSASVAAMVRFAEERYGALHVLFNNAGIFPDADGSVVDAAAAVVDRVIAVNLKGVVLGCKYGVPARLRGGGGAVVNGAQD